jgi:hypothetical protein
VRASAERTIVTAIVGATGCGKSTLVNSLARSAISPTGVIRPTTGAPLVWLRRGEDRVTVDADAVIVESDDPLLNGVTVIDTPDFDSTVEHHRDVAESVLSRADLCVFVTSARRYADQAAWEMLRIARHRRTPLYFVLNRLPPGSAHDLVADYASRLRRAGLLQLAERPRMLLIAEQRIDPTDQRLSGTAVEPLARFLRELSRPAARRAIVAGASLGRCRAAAIESRELAEAVDEEAAACRALAQAAEASFDVAAQQLEALLGASTSIDADVVAARVARLTESAAVATRVAWSSVEPGAALLRDPELRSWEAGEVEEQARKAAAEWLGSPASEGSATELLEILAAGAARFASAARTLAHPASRSAQLRLLADELVAASDSVYA